MPCYTQTEILDSLTAFVLSLITQPKADLSSFDERGEELVALALAHAGLSPEMSQFEFDRGLLQFIDAHPPRQELLDGLYKALRKRKKKSTAKKTR